MERPPRLIHNWLSLSGSVVAVGGLTGVLFFGVLELLSPGGRAYLGLAYFPIFGVILLGLLAIPLGMMREAQRRRKGRKPSLSRSVSIDLRRFRRDRMAVMLPLAGGVLTLIALGFGTATVRTLEFTESNAFCAEACHAVMHPEATVYQHSPHARIRCVECHVGTGAESYIRSKLSGLRQLHAVTFGSFEPPITTPIRNQRPARDLCERCHWPSRFIGYRELTRSYFLGDEQNTPMKVRMMMKIGGAGPGLIKGSGIHYHMLLASKVEYIARDPGRQEIVWVRITRSDGTVTEYEHAEYAPSSAEKDTLEIRTLDCLDCHNRPAHQFPSPAKSVNQAIDLNEIQRGLPFIKREAVRALDIDYPTQSEALNGIAKHLKDFYQRSYPKLIRERTQELESSILAIQSIYSRTIFPEMKAKWSAHPDNIGHLDWPGCFRCHNDEMESDEGDTIFTTCDRCHVILAQGEDVGTKSVHLGAGVPFWHPEDEDYLEEYTPCVDCHMGGADLYE